MEKIITEDNIKEVLAGELPVVIDFWAPWCGPCRMLSSTIEQLAEEMEGKAVICKCNVDDNDGISTEYGIRNIPTILYFKGGELKDRSVGLVQKKDIIDKISNL